MPFCERSYEKKSDEAAVIWWWQYVYEETQDGADTVTVNSHVYHQDKGNWPTVLQKDVSLDGL